jgi:hypothetical protein
MAGTLTRQTPFTNKLRPTLTRFTSDGTDTKKESGPSPNETLTSSTTPTVTATKEAEQEAPASSSTQSATELVEKIPLRGALTLLIGYFVIRAFRRMF